MAYDFKKDPDAVLDYSWDWSLWLMVGETITASVVIASPGITVNSSVNTNTVATVWLAGGTAGNPYTVTNRVTTSAGRTDDRTITIRVENR